MFSPAGYGCPQTSRQRAGHIAEARNEIPPPCPRTLFRPAMPPDTIQARHAPRHYSGPPCPPTLFSLSRVSGLGFGRRKLFSYVEAVACNVPCNATVEVKLFETGIQSETSRSRNENLSQRDSLKMLFERRRPKLPYFGTFFLDYNNENSGRDAVEDHSDRLPRTPIVRDFDIFCFLFSAASYLADICSDAAAAYIHYREQRMWAFTFIAILTVFPSIMLNIVSFLWWIDDVTVRGVQQSSESEYSKQLPFRIIICLFQVGPVVWYLEAALAAVKFRMTEKKSEKLQLYAVMIEAERDASLLRFFEAFLESAPQMLVQGVALAHGFYSLNPGTTVPKWMFIQVISISFSLLSSCWSFVVQHRSLRISRPDKENITPVGALMMLLWRMCTVLSRYSCLVLFILAYHYWIMIVFAVHFFLSLTHIALLQPLEIGTNCKLMEFGLIVLCAAVHLFAPYNMAEGRTRYRYIVAYCIEAIEIAILLNMVMNCALPYKRYVASGICILFFLGISFMLVYYGRFHPNVVHRGTRNVRSSSLPTSQIASSPLNRTAEES